MAKEIVVRPWLCTGCSYCALTCSIVNADEFNPEKSFVKIKKDDFAGLFTISFSSACRKCRQCAKECPSGALSEIEVPGPSGKDQSAGGRK